MVKSLAPGFLIASPPLGDPNFDRTVVLLAVHNDDGALGFVINRPGPMSEAELLGHAGYPLQNAPDKSIWVGGPVQPQSGWVISGSPGRQIGDGAIDVGGEVTVCSSKEAFEQLAEEVSESSVGATRHLIVLGYSGWAPEQLEGEIAQGAWLPTPMDPSILFDVRPDERWERAFALLGLSPSHLMSMHAGGDA